MITVKGGKICLSKTRKLSPKQEARLKGMSEKTRTDYLLSCVGLLRRRILVDKKTTSAADLLACKPSGSIKTLFGTIQSSGSHVNHTPHPGHSPSMPGDWIGIELECYVPNEEAECGYCGGSRYEYDEDDREQECSECSGSGRTTDGIYEDVRAELRRAGIYRCSVRDDGSLHPEDDRIGMEVCMLLNVARGWEPLEKLCALLKDKFDASVNTKCGLHVHFDYKAKGKEQVLRDARQFGYALPVLGKLVAKSRTTNEFCRMEVGHMDGGRYFAANLSAYNRHKTLEIRLHGGTLDAQKIKNWVTLNKHIFASDVKSSVSTYQDFLLKFDVPDTLVPYLDERYQKFNADDIAREERERALYAHIYESGMGPQWEEGLERALSYEYSEIRVPALGIEEAYQAALARHAVLHLVPTSAYYLDSIKQMLVPRWVRVQDAYRQIAECPTDLVPREYLTWFKNRMDAYQVYARHTSDELARRTRAAESTVA